MEIGVLGDLRVDSAGRRVSPGGPRSRDLLTVLLQRGGQSVDAAVLLELVWGGATGLGIAVVHTQVARLRRVLGPTVVVTTNTGYRLSGTTTDADRFAQMVSAAAEEPSPEAAIALLRDALGLWRGDTPFADVTPELVAPAVARLTEARLGAGEALVARMLELPGTPPADQALADVEDLITREPLRERPYELGMLAADRAGRQVVALDYYERLRTVLRDELGIDPGESARRLHSRVLRQLPLVEQRPAAHRLPQPPAATTRLVGRGEELAALTDLVRSRRAVTLVGPGGVGKSRLLGELAGQLDDRSMVFVDLSGIATPTPVDAVVDSLGRALGVAVDAEALGSLARAVGQRSIVLLIDEGERCPAALAQVLHVLLRDCPQLRVVVTSRQPVGVVGEALYAVSPLRCPDRQASVAEVASAPAVQLLVDRIGDHLTDWAPEADEWIRLARLARRVDGLPLALELLAAQASAGSLDSLDHFAEAPLQLNSDEVGRPERQRSLRETLTWSVERLPALQRATLGQLGVFNGPFTKPAALAVVEASGAGEQQLAESLRALVRDRILTVERGPAGLRYRLLRTIRDLAVEQLTADGGLQEARARHRRWHANRWRGALRSDALLIDVRDNYPDYLAALEDALAAGDTEIAAEVMLPLGRLWAYAELIAPGLHYSTRVLEQAELSPASRARVLTLRSTLQLDHDPAAVRRQLQEAIPLLEENADTVWLIGALGTSALEHNRAGDPIAPELARRGVAAARGSTPERQADALGVLAAVSAEWDPDESEVAAREAWQLANASRSAAAIASVGSNVAWAACGQGRPQIGADVARSAIAAQPHGTVPAFLRLNQAWADLLTGRPAAAVGGFAEVASMRRSEAEDQRIAEVLVGTACALTALEHPDAHLMLTGARSVADRTGLALTRWQRRLLDTAAERIGIVGPVWAEVSLPRLVLVLTAAASELTAADRSTPPGSGQ